MGNAKPRADPRQHNMTPIDYAKPGIEQPPRTRIAVERSENSITYIDPPLAGTQLRRRILLQMVQQSALVLAAALILFIWSRLPYAYILAGILLAVLTVNLSAPLRYWHAVATYPTIISLTRDALVATPPGRNCVFIPFSQLSDVHASKPRRLIWTPGRISSLVIAANGRRFYFMRCRDYVEVRWLARQIRLGAAMKVEHPNEPVPRVGRDVQESRDFQSLSCGRIPLSVDHMRNSRKPSPSGLSQVVWREYNNLGCAACGCLFFSIGIGAVAISYLVDAVVIILRFGSNAYFRQHVRFVPHRGSALSNGLSIGAQYEVLYVILCSIGMIVWTTSMLVTAMCINHLFTVARQRRRRQ
jgi:hypothetical protein